MQIIKTKDSSRATATYPGKSIAQVPGYSKESGSRDSLTRDTHLTACQGNTKLEVGECMAASRPSRRRVTFNTTYHCVCSAHCLFVHLVVLVIVVVPIAAVSPVGSVCSLHLFVYPSISEPSSSKSRTPFPSPAPPIIVPLAHLFSPSAVLSPLSSIPATCSPPSQAYQPDTPHSQRQGGGQLANM